jgi:hypothetical protein
VPIGNACVDLRFFDIIRIFGRYQADAPMVTISGEVLWPGRERHKSRVLNTSQRKHQQSIIEC